MKTLLFSTTLLLLAGCQLFNSGSADPVIRPGDTFRLTEGDTAILEPDGARLHFADVLEDSRCPTDVDCIWAGRAVLSMKLTVGRRTPADFRLVGLIGESAEGGREPSLMADTLGYQITLLGLAPYPNTQEERPARLVATFKVER